MDTFTLKIQFFGKSFSSKEVSKPKEAIFRYLGSFLPQSANLVPFCENFPIDEDASTPNFNLIGEKIIPVE